MKTFLLLHDFGAVLNMLTDSEAGQIIKAVFDYEINSVEPEFTDRTMQIVFFDIKRFLDTNRENYKRICRSRSENAKKRWEKSLSKSDESAQPDANAYNCIQEDAFTGKTNVKDKDKTNVKINVNDNADCTLTNSDTHSDKKAYGLFENVYLTKEEYNRVLTELAEGERRLESFSAYMKSSGKSYNDHYARLINWSCYENTASPVVPASRVKKAPGERRDPTFDVSEFTKKAVNIKYVPPEE